MAGSKASKSSGGLTDFEKIKEIFNKVKSDYQDGTVRNSQVRRDGDVILKLLGDGGSAKSGIFAITFAQSYDIDEKRARDRVRTALSALLADGKIDKTDEHRPSYSLANKQNNEA